ncbi:MAG TPA: glycosyltransferase family A protein [Candidatus Saccharimonadales bacterium]|nr:glycosyltransferase family A protein [Candidatus Saccharimonadales bacterium]
MSIIIPAYNAEKFLRDTIDSALAQTWPNKEIIIVDDGSSDGTLKIAKQFESKIVKVLTQKNRGAAYARNAGLAVAQGDFFQWLDADDLLAPDKIRRQLVDDPDSDGEVVHTCRYAKFHRYPVAARKVENNLCRDLKPREWLLASLSRGTWQATATWLVGRKITELAGPWDERLVPGVNDDGEYFTRIISLSSGIKFHKLSLSFYRVGNAQSLSQVRSQQAWKSILLSVNLSIDHLFKLDNSESARKAALAFLQYTAEQYGVSDTQTWQSFLSRAGELGGNLRFPANTLRFRAARMLIGQNAALRVRTLVARAKWATSRQRERLFSLLAARSSNQDEPGPNLEEGFPLGVPCQRQQKKSL